MKNVVRLHKSVKIRSDRIETKGNCRSGARPARDVSVVLPRRYDRSGEHFQIFLAEYFHHAARSVFPLAVLFGA